MSRDPVMSRLADANPDHIVHMGDQKLRDLIVSHTPPWRSNDEVGKPRLRRGWVAKVSLVGGLRSRIAASGMVAAAVAVALVVSLSGSAPNVAQAFPALNGPFTLTPAALQQSLKIYGVSPGNDGINITKGRTVTTPWGTGYILAGPDHRFVCVVAPGLSSADWGASCAQTTLAISSGTARTEYAYDPATHSARLLALLPKGATATMQTNGGEARQLVLSRGLLAVDITSPTQIAVTINGHTTTDQFSPHDATPASSGPSGSATATTVTATPSTSTTP